MSQRHFPVCVWVYCATLVYDYLANWAPLWPRLLLVPCSLPLFFYLRDHRYIASDERLIAQYLPAEFSHLFHETFNSNENCVRRKKSQKTCSLSQTKPRHRDHTMCAYPSISPMRHWDQFDPIHHRRIGCLVRPGNSLDSIFYMTKVGWWGGLRPNHLIWSC